MQNAIDLSFVKILCCNRSSNWDTIPTFWILIIAKLLQKLKKRNGVHKSKMQVPSLSVWESNGILMGILWEGKVSLKCHSTISIYTLCAMA